MIEGNRGGRYNESGAGRWKKRWGGVTGGKNRKGRCNERREMKSWRKVSRRKVDGIRRLSKE